MVPRDHLVKPRPRLPPPKASTRPAPKAASEKHLAHDTPPVIASVSALPVLAHPVAHPGGPLAVLRPSCDPSAAPSSAPFCLSDEGTSPHPGLGQWRTCNGSWARIDIHASTVRRGRTTLVAAIGTPHGIRSRRTARCGITRIIKQITRFVPRPSSRCGDPAIRRADGPPAGRLRRRPENARPRAVTVA